MRRDRARGSQDLPIAVFEVHISARSIAPFAELVGNEMLRAVERVAAVVRGLLGSCVVWNVSSTAAGGGVAEMLRSLLRYARGLQVDVRWIVVEGPPEFFRITKRVHNALHGWEGDASALGPAEAAVYERVLCANAIALDALVKPCDVVICHDPQTAGLIPHLLARGAHVVWRCHIGNERHESEVDRAWSFLRPYLEGVPVAVFTREAYAPAWLSKRTVVLPPNIDPFSAKNRAMDAASMRAILAAVGLVSGPLGDGQPVFVRDDGSVSRVERAAEILQLGRSPSWDTPLVVQVSRWDWMKDPLGVMRGFTQLIAPHAPRGAHLVLTGPALGAVADDPESRAVFAQLEDAWRAMPEALRSHVHLALLPMKDIEENAAIVNALQRHATVIVQKSVQEGFGLTVTEAMWKRRPVVASAVGGIQDQIRDGVDGLLIRDPRNAGELAAALRRVLEDDALAAKLGDAAYERVRRCYLSINALTRWAEIVRQLFAA